MSEAVNYNLEAMLTNHATISDAQARIAELHDAIAESSDAIGVRREDFIRSCGQQIASGAVAGRFESAEDYFRFLARVGRDQYIDPTDSFDTTNQTAAVIAGLYKPNNYVAAYTYDRSRRSSGWSIGRIMTGTEACVDYGGLYDAPVLAVATPLATADGKGQNVRFSITEIAERFKDEASTGRASSFVVAGAPAVAEIVNVYYPVQDISPQTQALHADSKHGFLEALANSGLSLHELGYSKHFIASEQTIILRRLDNFIRGYSRYQYDDAYRLAPTCESAAQAYELILSRLPHDDAAFEIDSYFASQLESLRYEAEPQTP